LLIGSSYDYCRKDRLLRLHQHQRRPQVIQQRLRLVVLLRCGDGSPGYLPFETCQGLRDGSLHYSPDLCQIQGGHRGPLPRIATANALEERSLDGLRLDTIRLVIKLLQPMDQFIVLAWV